MKGRIPHIILRFSRTVAPPGGGPGPAAPPAPPAAAADDVHTPDGVTADSNSDSSSSSSDSSADEDTSDDEGDTTTTEEFPELSMATTTQTISGIKRRINHDQIPGANAAATRAKSRKKNDDGGTRRAGATYVTASATGKRKRDIPKSIGGGKGDLQPPHKRPAAPAAAPAASPAVRSDDAEKKEEKRVLRSQDTIKKSEYEEWFEEPTSAFDYNMQLKIIRPPSKHAATPAAEKPADSRSLKPPPKTDTELSRLRAAPIQKLSLEDELPRATTRVTADPLADDLYAPVHRAEERREKRLRNIEKEVLAHNIERVEKDLEKLHSPDWVKSIGLSAAVVARASKKQLVERRKKLIAHLEGMVEKHRMYKEAERRKRTGEGTPTPPPPPPTHPTSKTVVSARGVSAASGVDEEEEQGKRRASAKKPRRSSDGPVKAAKEEEREFTSFYDKPYLRQKALSGWRKSGRTVTAFGGPVPPMVEREFELPEWVLDGTGKKAT